jgi:hypothetical protein
MGHFSLCKRERLVVDFKAMALAQRHDMADLSTF